MEMYKWVQREPNGRHALMPLLYIDCRRHACVALGKVPANAPLTRRALAFLKSHSGPDDQQYSPVLSEVRKNPRVAGLV